MFTEGDVVTYRELWASEVMTALPMRVIADTSDSVVLYLAPETTFQAARDPGGGPVRSLDRWVSVPRTWKGGSLVRIVPRGHWYAVDLEYDSDRTLTGYYVNFQEPIRSTARGFDTVDLVLDLQVDLQGHCQWKDEGDFTLAVSAGLIHAQTADVVVEEAARMAEAVARDGAPPQSRKWLEWRPPLEWNALTLTDGWQEIPT